MIRNYITLTFLSYNPKSFVINNVPTKQTLLSCFFLKTCDMMITFMGNADSVQNKLHDFKRYAFDDVK